MSDFLLNKMVNGTLMFLVKCQAIKVSFHTKVERKEMMQKHEIAYFDYIENWGFENDNLIKMSFL